MRPVGGKEGDKKQVEGILYSRTVQGRGQQLRVTTMKPIKVKHDSEA